MIYNLYSNMTDRQANHASQQRVKSRLKRPLRNGINHLKSKAPSTKWTQDIIESNSFSLKRPLRKEIKQFWSKATSTKWNQTV